ncbi:MAG: ATP-binding protein [Bacteriovoracaceae bacterium]|jgi:ATP-dependent 26S proteasome regulatory subunit|nr:ATP-binding protein [Bacteriovoracaceae bacterium]
MKQIYKILLLTGLLAFGSASFAKDADDPNFNNWPNAAYSWLNVTSLGDTHSLTTTVLSDFVNLHYVATSRYLNDPASNYTIYDRAAYVWGQRVPISTDYVQVNNHGGSELMMVGGGYYFVHIGKDKSTAKRAIIAVRTDYYRNYVTIYTNDSNIDLTKSILKNIESYLDKKNIYKNGVVEFKEYKIGFMQNTNNYQYKWDDLIIDKTIKDVTYLNTHEFLNKFPTYKTYGVKPKKGILLQGPPGTGKSFLGQIMISNVLHGNLKNKSSFFYLSARHLNGSKRIKRLFDAAKLISPTTLFMEDIDLVGVSSRGGSKKPVYNQIVLNEFLNGLDGLVESEGILTVATTNRGDALDPALLRSGRLGLHITFDLPKFSVRKEFFIKYGKRKAVWDVDVDVEWLASESEKFSGADIIEAIDLAKQMAFQQNSKTKDGENLLLTKAHFAKAFSIISVNQDGKSFIQALDVSSLR